MQRDAKTKHKFCYRELDSFISEEKLSQEEIDNEENDGGEQIDEENDATSSDEVMEI